MQVNVSAISLPYGPARGLFHISGSSDVGHSALLLTCEDAPSQRITLSDFNVSSEYVGMQVPYGLVDTMLASETVLAEDWNTPEEDTAWAHL